jgi:hypothetical protein
MRRAIVTLAIGSNYLTSWNKFCRSNWLDYGRKHNIDILVLDAKLDFSHRAEARSPSWQKCLIFEQKSVLQYDQVAWFDTDIFFNVKDAPNIFDEVPFHKVGAVDSFSDPTYLENKIALSRLWELFERNSDSAGALKYKSPEDIYKSYGEPVFPIAKMLNAGVLVMSPKHHRDIFRHVYENYEDRGPSSYYENVPLSFELVKNDLVHWVDPRFNHLWTWSKILHYPFLMGTGRTFKDKILRHASRLLGNDYEGRVKSICATTALMNCYCLHFAGYGNEMSLVDFEILRQGVGYNLGIR